MKIEAKDGELLSAMRECIGMSRSVDENLLATKSDVSATN